MRVLRVAREGLSALRSSKLRTFFMMVGTVVGIAALTVIMAAGAGTESQVMNRVSVFGPRAIMVLAGGSRTFPSTMDATTLTLADAQAIRGEVSGIEALAPTVRQRGLGIRAGAVQVQATVFGIEPEWHTGWEWYVNDGAHFTDEEVASMARVCVLGRSVVQDLFGDDDAVGEWIQIGNVRFQVKGLLERRGMSPAGGDMDNRVLVPLPTAMRRLFNQDHLDQIRVKMKEGEAVQGAAETIRILLGERHHITPAMENDFSVRTAVEVAAFVRGMSGTLSMLLAGLAILALIVGGVVLMNILLISVSERVQEIGLRRALGANRRDIFHQFLAESLTVTLAGMAIGSAAGWVICAVLARVSELPIAVSWQPFALGIATSLVIGLFFGIQPARRAARQDPVQALR